MAVLWPRLEVYERMLADGMQPSATTYTALISAYGKAGKVLAPISSMIRYVIACSSLISWFACQCINQRCHCRSLMTRATAAASAM